MTNSDSDSSITNSPLADVHETLDTKTTEKSPTPLNADRFSKAAAKNAKKMAKRTYVAQSPIHGKGLFASKAIKAGVTLGRLQGMLTDDDGTYVLWLNKKIGLEITNEFRFINHDSNPNCALTDTKVVTLRAVEKDEEFTHDYGW